MSLPEFRRPQRAPPRLACPARCIGVGAGLLLGAIWRYGAWDVATAVTAVGALGLVAAMIGASSDRRAEDRDRSPGRGRDRGWCAPPAPLACAAMIWSRRGGSDDGPLLVLLHGLAGRPPTSTRDVEQGARRQLGGRVAGGRPARAPPQRRGGAVHVRRPRRRRAAAAPPRTATSLVLGHSIGGGGGAGASRHVAESRWSRSESRSVARGARRVRPAGWPSRPVTFLATREEAMDALPQAARSRRPHGVPTPVSSRAPQGWRVAQDPATFGVGVPDMAGLLAAASCPVVLARWRARPDGLDADLRALVPDPVHAARGRVTTRTSRIPAAVARLAVRFGR